MSTYLYDAFDCILLLCHLRVSENPDAIVAWMSRNSLLQEGAKSSLAKWLSVSLRTKWMWARVQLQSLKLQISRLLLTGSSLTFRQIYRLDSL